MHAYKRRLYIFNKPTAVFIIKNVSRYITLPDCYFRIGSIVNSASVFLCFVFYNTSHAVRKLRIYNNGSAVFYYPGFFVCDFLKSISQPLRMIKRYCHDYAYCRHAYIGSIQSAAKSHFYNRKIDFFPREIFKRYCSKQFKFRRVMESVRLNFIRKVFYIFRYLRKIFTVCKFSVYLYSFRFIYYRRRRKKTRFISVCAKRTAYIRRSGTLSVCPCNMYCFEFCLRIPHFTEQIRHNLKSEL